MKPPIQKFREFIATPIGAVILFVLIFYTMTFLVYWFYSPGPEERRQAEITTGASDPNKRAASGLISVEESAINL